MCLYDGLILKAHESLDSFGGAHRGRFRGRCCLSPSAVVLPRGKDVGQPGRSSWPRGRLWRRAGPLRGTCSRPGFLDGAGVIWLSRSAASAAAPAPFPGPSSAKLCPWTPKPLPLPAFLKRPIKLSYSRPEAIEESFLPRLQ